MLGYRAEYTRWLICDHCGKTTPKNKNRYDPDAVITAMETAKKFGWVFTHFWNEQEQQADIRSYCPNDLEHAK